jgi:hypothetical protein
VGEVSISRSVGAGGANLRADVLTIQNALNRVPDLQGGASPALTLDGLCGPLTTGAIRRFQTAQFPEVPADARIDPGQRTLRRLNDLLARGAPLSFAAGFVPLPGDPIFPSVPAAPKREPTLPMKTHEDDSDIFFLLANLWPRTTGLPFVVWISPATDDQNDVCVRVSRGLSPSDMAVVAIRPDLRVVQSELSGGDLALLRTWVELNREVLEEYWDGEIEFTEHAIAALRPIAHE